MVLAFGELGGAAGGFEAVFFAFFHSGVAGEEAGGFEGGAVILADEEQGAGDAVADGAGLTGDAAAGDGSYDVDFIELTGRDQGLANDEFKGIEAEVVVDIAAIDRDGAGTVLEQVDPSDGGFPAAGSVEVGFFAFIHDGDSFLLLGGPGFGFLSGVGVIAAAVDVQAGKGVAGDGIFGHHAAHGQLHSQLGAILH